VDGLVLVVESGGTSRNLMRDLRARFEAGGVEPIGLVLNKMDFHGTGYGQYAKAYQAYYQSAASLKAAPASEEAAS
jgi:Mrp family chromosome partitioning ATPase